jgi:hypothetical protein
LILETNEIAAMEPPHNYGIWKTFELSDDTLRTWQAGDLTCWYRRRCREVLLSFSHSDVYQQSDPPPDPGPEVVWNRWSLSGDIDWIKVSPIFPDRAMIIKPEVTFRVLKQVKTRFFVRVPLWVRFEVQSGNESTALIDIPTVNLSRTWFGDFVEGEVCYWISSGVQSRIEPDPFRPFLAICPLLVTNRSDNDLSITKINLPVPHLSLFFHQGQLWADDTTIVFKGEGEISQIQMEGKAPAEAALATMITPPRTPTKKSFSTRAFASLKELSGLGIPNR